MPWSCALEVCAGQMTGRWEPQAPTQQPNAGHFHVALSSRHINQKSSAMAGNVPTLCALIPNTMALLGSHILTPRHYML